jgi:hypothetical protein
VGIEIAADQCAAIIDAATADDHRRRSQCSYRSHPVPTVAVTAAAALIIAPHAAAVRVPPGPECCSRKPRHQHKRSLGFDPRQPRLRLPGPTAARLDVCCEVHAAAVGGGGARAGQCGPGRRPRHWKVCRRRAGTETQKRGRNPASAAAHASAHPPAVRPGAPSPDPPRTKGRHKPRQKNSRRARRVGEGQRGCNPYVVNDAVTAHSAVRNKPPHCK